MPCCLGDASTMLVNLIAPDIYSIYTCTCQRLYSNLWSRGGKQSRAWSGHLSRSWPWPGGPQQGSSHCQRAPGGWPPPGSALPLLHGWTADIPAYKQKSLTVHNDTESYCQRAQVVCVHQVHPCTVHSRHTYEQTAEDSCITLSIHANVLCLCTVIQECHCINCTNYGFGCSIQHHTSDRSKGHQPKAFAWNGKRHKAICKLCLVSAMQLHLKILPLTASYVTGHLPFSLLHITASKAFDDFANFITSMYLYT